PAGPCVVGEDLLAASGHPHRVMDIGDFFMARFHVTCAEYLDFINALAARDAAEAARRTPRVSATEGHYWRAGPDGRFALPGVDPEGDRWEPDWPVMGISFDDAQAYCAWRGARDGRRYRLPTIYEYEKAARGTDGRRYPWGDHFDPTFCKMKDSRAGGMKPEAVGAYPTDESPYGVRDLAGGARSWCDTPRPDAPHMRAVKGGAWPSNEVPCRSAYYDFTPADDVRTNFGFRLCHDP
ncbi:MAG TPA: SUMF1/EgtB/PvdO family nonheme iron enzyme, partial [Myxococcota bacterium]|nr:SUMF1/EgtB/PvdO family nonheme iron enzyme [Myxococcota bacterium]